MQSIEKVFNLIYYTPSKGSLKNYDYRVILFHFCTKVVQNEKIISYYSSFGNLDRDPVYLD